MSVRLSVLLLLCYYIGHMVYKHLTYWNRLGIACEPPHWLLGNFAGVTTQRSFDEIFQNYYDKYKCCGPFAGFYWFTKAGVMVMDPELAKHILIKDFSKFTDRIMYCNEQDDPLTGQLFNLPGQRWRHMRNKLSPTFTANKMRIMFPLVLNIGQEFVQIFEQELECSDVLNVSDLVARFTTDVIGSCAFGLEIKSLQHPGVEFRKMSRKAFIQQRYGTLGFVLRFGFPEMARRLHIKETMADVEKFFMDIVKETIDFRELHQIRRNDFMDTLIDLKNNRIMINNCGEQLTNPFSFGQIAAQAFVFLLAGYETSSTTMGFALYELARNPEIQIKARNEVRKVLEKHKQIFTYECVKDMVYLEQIMQETLRMYTIAPALLRQALEDYVVPGYPHYVIKKGMPVFIPSSAMHKDGRYFPQPHTFNPDNFSPEKVASRESGLNLSFGDGPRNCIGMRFAKMARSSSILTL
uniref:Cytochrome P450 n=1 Tax=Stomoxys calcitrans TaxID=35570 RepID=A0A1I8P8W7_STOCA